MFQGLCLSMRRCGIVELLEVKVKVPLSGPDPSINNISTEYVQFPDPSSPDNSVRFDADTVHP